MNMSSKVRIQSYLKRNRISELFEEMMTKLVQDLPSEPVEYLVNLLQKRLTIAGKAQKSSSKDTNFKHSLSRPTSNAASMWSDKKSHSSQPKPAKLSSSVDIAEGRETEESRHYSKPWLSNSKKEKSPVKDKQRKHGLSQTLPAQSKPDWDGRTKTGMVDIDGARPTTGDRSDGEDVDLRLVYTKPKIYGKDIDLVMDNDATELECNASSAAVKKSKTYSKPLSATEAKRRRRQQIRDTTKENEKNDKGRNRSQLDPSADDDDALEVYEDLNDLSTEGVEDPPKTGVYTSGNIHHRKEEIELVLNMSKFFDSLGGAVSVANYSTKSKSAVMQDNDDFESASQVTGPRHPVWETPESEIESVVSQTRQARLANAAMFDFTSTTPKEKEVKSALRSKNGSTVVGAPTKKKSRSQLSGLSNRSANLRRSLTDNNGRNQSAANSVKGSPRSRTGGDPVERPKTAQ